MSWWSGVNNLGEYEDQAYNAVPQQAQAYSFQFYGIPQNAPQTSTNPTLVQAMTLQKQISKPKEEVKLTIINVFNDALNEFAIRCIHMGIEIDQISLKKEGLKKLQYSFLEQASNKPYNHYYRQQCNYDHSLSIMTATGSVEFVKAIELNKADFNMEKYLKTVD